MSFESSLLFSMTKQGQLSVQSILHLVEYERRSNPKKCYIHIYSSTNINSRFNLLLKSTKIINFNVASLIPSKNAATFEEGL